MTLHIVYGQRALKQSYLVEITQGGQTCYLCSLQSIEIDSNRQRYRPLVIQVSDIISDNDGFQRFQITLRMKGPYLMGSTNYATAAQFYRAVGLEGALVTVRERGAVATIAHTEPRITNATVERVTDVTQTTFTIECEPRGHLERTFCPFRVIDRTTFSTQVLNDRVPEESIGEAIPANWGRAITWADHTTHARSADDIFDMNAIVSASGIPPVVHPCIEIQRQGPTSYWSHAEWINATGQLSSPLGTDVNNRVFAWSYVDEAKAWAHLWDISYTIAQNDVFDNRCHFLAVDRVPYLRLPLIASAFVEDESEAVVTDPEKALDGRQDTCAIVNHTAALPGACYELRNDIPPLGHISHNSKDLGGGLNDFEGVDAPAGLRAFALVSFTSDMVLPSTGNLYILLSFPGRPEDPLFGSTLYPAAFFDEAEKYYKITHPIRIARDDGATGSSGTGWWGTNFANWRFNAEKSGALSLPGSDNERVFRVQLFNNLGVPVKLHSIGLEVSYRTYISPLLQSWIERNWQQAQAELKKNRNKTNIDIGGRGGAQWKIPDSIERHGWGRGPGLSTASERYIPRALGISCNSYRDDASGTYTGTANATLTNPISVMKALIRGGGYGGRSSDTFVGSTNAGSWDVAMDLLDRWASIANGSARSWTQRVILDRRRTIEENLVRIRSQLPETHVRKNANGHWECYVYIPSQADWPASTLYGTLDPDEVLLRGSEAIDLQLFSSGENDIVNEMEVAYAYDSGPGVYRRTARVSAIKSDNGADQPWPITPITSVQAHQIVAWSQDVSRYGRRLEPIKLDLQTTDDPVIATAVGCYRLWRFHRQRPMMEFGAIHQLRDLSPGMIFQWSDKLQSKYGLYTPFWGDSPSPPQENTDWDSIYWLCLSNEGRDRTHLRIVAEWIPRVVAAQVLGGFFLGGEIGSPGEDIAGPLGPIGEL